MVKQIFAAALFALFTWAAAPAIAETVCTETQSCREAVANEAVRQTEATLSGEKWVLSKAGCDIASREQEQSERACKSYDLQEGGKTREQCAKCYRQAKFDAARWEQCAAQGWAPKPPKAIYESIARLGAEWVEKAE